MHTDMAKLVDLSSELLLIIASYLATGDDVDTMALLSLCYTSRALLVIALPALYTRVRIPETTPDPLNSLKCFLRTIMQRPELAKTTQELALHNDRGIRYEWPALQYDSYFMDISSMISGHLQEIEPEFCYSPLAAEVLARLPNLQHIHFTADIEQPRALLEHVHRLHDESAILSKLKTFHLHKRYEDGPIDIRDYVQFLQYPSFEQLSTESDVPNIPGSFCATNILTPSSLELFWCLEPPSKMEEILKACSHLTRFEFVVPSFSRHKSMSDVAYDPLIGPRELATMLLATHSSTLATIRLDYQHSYSFRDPEMRSEVWENGGNLTDNDFTYQSFLGFENLKSLSVEFEKLIKARNLPASLESLELSHCHFMDLDQEYLVELLRLKETQCPMIDNVSVTGFESTNEGITLVLELARLLDAPVQVTGDGRTLKFSGAASYLRVQSRVALPFEESIYDDDMDSGEEGEESSADDERENGEMEDNEGDVDETPSTS